MIRFGELCNLKFLIVHRQRRCCRVSLDFLFWFQCFVLLPGREIRIFIFSFVYWRQLWSVFGCGETVGKGKERMEVFKFSRDFSLWVMLDWRYNGIELRGNFWVYFVNIFWSIWNFLSFNWAILLGRRPMVSVWQKEWCEWGRAKWEMKGWNSCFYSLFCLFVFFPWPLLYDLCLHFWPKVTFFY